jgi:hypothetical protein
MKKGCSGEAFLCKGFHEGDLERGFLYWCYDMMQFPYLRNNGRLHRPLLTAQLSVLIPSLKKKIYIYITYPEEHQLLIRKAKGRRYNLTH